MLEWRQICNDFSKWIDKDLPFIITPLQMRDTMKAKGQTSINPRHQRVRTREQPGNLAMGRATFIQAGSKSIRRQFHNLPVELPPPPESSYRVNIKAEHSYV